MFLQEIPACLSLRAKKPVKTVNEVNSTYTIGTNQFLIFLGS